MKNKKKCKTPGCNRRPHGNGLCNSCYHNMFSVYIGSFPKQSIRIYTAGEELTQNDRSAIRAMARKIRHDILQDCISNPGKYLQNTGDK